MKFKKMRGVMSVAALLLALTLPPAAHGQSDGFLNNADGVRDGSNGGFWNGMNGGGSNGGLWNGMNGGGGNGGLWNGMNGDGNGGGQWNGMNGDGSGGASWNSMEDATPVGDGLLLLVVSGVCYAAAKNRRKSKN